MSHTPQPAPRPQMRLTPSQGLRTEQRQILDLRQIQALECLQCPSVELEEWLRERANENPALTVGESPRAPRLGSASGENRQAFLEAQARPGIDSVELVRQQVRLLDLDSQVRDWTLFLVEQLDGSGLLSSSDEQLLTQAQALGILGGAQKLGFAIGILQGLEPKGIGARNTDEVLLLQLDPSDDDYPTLCCLIEECFGQLAKGRLRWAEERLGIDRVHLQQLLAKLARLNTQPLEAESASAHVLIPEVRVRLGVVPPEGGQPQTRIELVRGLLPEIGLDEDLLSLSKDRAAASDARSWAKRQTMNARQIVDAVQQRQTTLLLVSQAVFAHQRRWLEEPGGPMVPLTMGDLADELGVATSTISRTVAGKCADTPRGIVPLRNLFQLDAGGGARDDVRNLVQKLIASEPSSRPLSDEALVAQLGQRGIHVARRTVAKYRSELSIPSTYERRVVGARDALSA